MDLRLGVGLLFVLLAGCSGLQATEGPRPSPTASSPTTVTVGPTTTQTTTATPDSSRQNPWGKAVVAVAIRPTASVKDPDRHGQHLHRAIEWFNARDRGDYPVTFRTRRDAPADVRITVRPTIDECGGEVARGTFSYCSPTLDRDAAPDAPVSATVVSRYETNATQMLYRSVLVRLAGRQRPERVAGIDSPVDPDLVDPFPTHSPVPVSVRGAPDHVDAIRQIRHAIDYWETGPGAPYRNYSVEFVVEPNNTDAPVTVAYVDEIDDCGVDEDDGTHSAGCAPLLSGDDPAPAVTRIRISTQYVSESTSRTLEHEFGHVYGRKHGMEPLSLMQATGNLTRVSELDVSKRPQPWMNDTIRAYVALDSASPYERDAFDDEANTALRYLSDGADGHVPANVTFERVQTPARADVSINVSDSLTDAASTSVTYGTDTDRDESLEEYSSQTITLSDDADTDEYGYHIAYWIARTFVGVGEELPDRLDPESADRDGWYRGY